MTAAQAAAVAECLEAAVREVISDPALSMADLIGVLEDLVVGETLDTVTTGDQWTAPARWISRGDVRIGLAPGEPCSYRVMIPGILTRPRWPETAAENDRLSQLIRGDT